MFIEQANLPDNKFWKYIVGTVCIIMAIFIAQIPLVIAITAQTFATDQPFPVNNEEMMGILDSNLMLFLMLLSFAGGLAMVFIIARFLHKQSLRGLTTARPKIDWKRVRFAFLLWAAITFASLAVDYTMSPEDYVFNFKPIPFLILVVVAVIMIPLQTSAEEYIFRSYLMQGIGIAAGNRWVPLLSTSLIFGLMHIANPEVTKMGNIIMIYYIGTGLFLGIVTLMDDGIELPLGFHAANNLVGALLVTSEWTAFQTESLLRDVSDPSAGFDVILPVLVVFPLLLLFFSKKYKWTNWKEKLTGNITYHANTISESTNGEPDLQRRSSEF